MKPIYIRRARNKAMKFATAKHVPKGLKELEEDVPYRTHLADVARIIMLAALKTEKFDVRFAVQVALLHHTIEDKVATYKELEHNFGEDIAEAVFAITKNEAQKKEQPTKDSLSRIRKLKSEVWAVKLADMITNLQPPPLDWSKVQRINNHDEARLVLTELGSGDTYLAKWLEDKMKEYVKYI